MSRVFFDTNILVYGYSDGEPRQAMAQHLIAEGGIISVQSLNEFASVALRKLRMPWPTVIEALQVIRELCKPIVTLDTHLHLIGLRIAERHRLSIYDAMIVAAALIADCGTLYSEDMQHGLLIDGQLRVCNPFLAS